MEGGGGGAPNVEIQRDVGRLSPPQSICVIE